MRTRLDARTLRLHGAAPRRTLHAGRRRPRFSLCLSSVYGRSPPKVAAGIGSPRPGYFVQKEVDAMPVGATKKEKRQYEKIKKSAKKSGRYGGRAEEVAARTVMKKRRQKGKAKTKTSSGRTRKSAKKSSGRKSTTRAKKAAAGRKGGRKTARRRSRKS